MISASVVSLCQIYSQKGGDMINNEEGIVIATRRYFVELVSHRIELILTIERPFESQPGFFRCIYRLRGDEERTRYSEGVDELDALISTLSLAGTDLQYLNQQKYEGKLRWEAGPADSSLPTIRDHWPFSKPDYGVIPPTPGT
jgi:hypothetical protein